VTRATAVRGAMKDIAEWLTSIGLGEHAERFAENDIDLSVVRDLTEQDLKDMGVEKVGHRRKILRSIAEFDWSTLPATESQPRQEAERRQLTVMFCDLVGSTALSARLDPEQLLQVMNSYQDCVHEVAEVHFEGVIAQRQGDGALVYFGYPRAQEDDAERALRAGLALVDAIANVRIIDDVRLQVRIGIATGDVLIRESSMKQEIVGEPPNIAARLQALADPGTVLICPNTHRLTGGHFDYRNLGPQTLKGLVDSVIVWQVLGTSGVVSRFEAMHKSELPPLFGREEEIDLLLRRWHTAHEEGRVVMLTGEPGIGKSHITLALDERIRNEQHTTLRYFCSAHHTNSVLFPFIGQLERAAEFERNDSLAEKLSKLDALIARSTANPEHVAILANLLALSIDDRSGLLELSPQRRKEKTLGTLLAQLEGLAARQPVLVIFEDIHWIDPTSLEVLATTVERIPQSRVLLLLTARPEFTPPWPSYPHVTTIPLTRLGRRAGSQLVDRVTEGKALPKAVMDEILIRTDGVPMFIEELTKTVLESGLLEEREGHYVLDHPLPSLAIPTTLHASLMTRLDRLAPARVIAQTGAVAGREFHYELLNAVTGLPREKLEEALTQLVRSELIFKRGEIPHAVYTFRHTLVRDAAYSSLVKSRREFLHAAIAKALEQQFPEVVRTQPETLAHHLTEAGVIEKATGYWLQAGKDAALRSANLEAIAHVERGIELVGRLPAGESKDRSELDLQLVLGPCLIATQGPAASTAVATFARARELCKRLGEPPEYLQVMFWLATVNVVRGELPQGLEAIADLPAAAQARGNRPALLNGIRGRGMILMFMARLLEARATLQQAVELFDTMAEADRKAAWVAGQDAGVSTLVLMAWVCWILGQVDEAVTRMAAALKRADAVQHAHTHAYAWYYAAVLHALRGEPAIAQSYAERCLAISEQHGFRHWLGLSRAIRGICTTMQDDSSGQLDEVKSALDDYERSGYQLGITAQFVLLCHVLLIRNEPEAALEVIDKGLRIVSCNSERFFEAELYRLKARALRMHGAPDSEAEFWLDRALRTARDQHALSLELRAATDLAKLWMNEGKRTAAHDVLALIYDRFTEGFDTRDLREAKALHIQLQ
jgi:class 3 adenylate cyclase/tetratricopeptide (TPR) repeat protein